MPFWRRLRLALPVVTLALAACGPEIEPECDAADDPVCDDEDPCTRDVCDAGVCVNTIDNTLVPPQVSPLDCKREVCQDDRVVQVADDTETPNDGVACTIDRCQGGVPVATPDDAGCGAAPDCKRLVCDPDGVQGAPNAQGCVALNDDANLPDDNADCTADSCQNGVAIFAPDDGVCAGVSGETAACVAELCDPLNQNTSDGSGCAVIFADDECDDGNFCTQDACDPNAAGANPVTGCTVTPVAGTPPQIDGNCQSEICQGGNPTQVDDDTDVPSVDGDGIACTVPGCQGGDPVETPSNAACDDGLACTQDVCVAAVGCAANPNNALCPGQACDPAQDPGQNPSGCVDADVCPPVVPVSDGQSVNGNTAGFNNDQQASCADNTGAHPDLAFALTLTEDSDVVASVSSLDGHGVAVTILEISGGACGRELLCDAASAGAASVSVVNLAAGSYAVVVDGTGAAAQAGGFQLTVTTAASSIAAGDLVINEFHPNPNRVADAAGEFIELANPGAIAVSTAGVTLSDNGGAATQLVAGAGGAQLIVAPGGFLVGVGNVDPALNGGVTPGFDLNLSLNNTATDNFVLAKGAAVIDALNEGPAGFPSATDGASFQLDPTKKAANQNDTFAGTWCVTPSATYGLGDKGSPGLENESCSPSGCTVATQAVDCNDNNVCTDDLCVGGACQNPANNAQVPSDGFSCTTDTCQGGNPVFTPNNGACNDGVACTVDACVGAGGAAGTGCQNTPNNALCGANQSCDPVQGCVGGSTAGDGCADSVALQSGTPANADTTGFVNDIAPSCAASGPDAFFSLTLAATSAVTLELSPASANLSVSIFEGSCATPRELACVNQPVGGESLEIRGLAAGGYLIVVDSGATNEAGAFTLTATVTPGDLAAGDVIITELMPDPTGALIDASAEYIELNNPRPFFISTSRLRLAGAANNGTAIGAAQLVVPPGGFLIGARSADTAVNGGLAVDFTFSENLNNSGTDAVQVRIDNGATIDIVTYTVGANGFPAVAAGQAYNLDPDRFNDALNDGGANWCNASAALGATQYAASNFGTPRQQNVQCPGVN